MALIDKITENVVKVPLESSTKPEVLKELLHLLVVNGQVKDEASVYDSLLERESLGSTGLENGIAVPHPKTAAVNDLQIAIGIAPDGIEFQALDGGLSRLFFMILAAPDQSGLHIEALSEIAGMSRSTAFLRALVAASTPGEVVRLIHE
jgi:mannitol/fructose-specific phosphotransferase system IIA component (Ntr-type)